MSTILQESAPQTLMTQSEPHLVGLIFVISLICRSLTGSESLALANNLIYGTQVKNDITQWKNKGMSLI